MLQLPVLKQVLTVLPTHHPSHKSHNASEKYPTLYHFVTEMCTHVHISVTKWCSVGLGNATLWDLWNRSKISGCCKVNKHIQHLLNATHIIHWFVSLKYVIYLLGFTCASTSPALLQLNPLKLTMATAQHCMLIRGLKRETRWPECEYNDKIQHNNTLQVPDLLMTNIFADTFYIRMWLKGSNINFWKPWIPLIQKIRKF